jgi:hypothetical protein
MALMRVAVPPGLPSGDYEGMITFSAPQLGLQEETTYTIVVQPGFEEMLYPELSRQELQVDLIWPGTPDEGDPEEIIENTPLFEWFSSGRFFDFHLFDITQADEMVGAVAYTKPIYEENDLTDVRLYYPLGAEPLVPGHIYAWYVEAKDIPGYDPRVSGREPFVIQSEIFYFKYIDLAAAGGEAEVLGIEVEPEFLDGVLEEEYEFTAILELAGAGFADVTWRVVPGSAAIVIGRGEYAYVTPLKEGWVSVIAESGGMSDYAVMRIGGEDISASVEFGQEDELELRGKVDAIASKLEGYTLAEVVDAATERTRINLQFMKAEADYHDALNEAYELVEPFFLSGKASARKPAHGDWYLVEPFSEHMEMYINDKRAYETFVSRKLRSFARIQADLLISHKGLTRSDEKVEMAVMEWFENYEFGIPKAVGNIGSEIEQLDKDLGIILNAMEVDAGPFLTA